jgi:hypothetical protein
MRACGPCGAFAVTRDACALLMLCALCVQALEAELHGVSQAAAHGHGGADEAAAALWRHGWAAHGPTVSEADRCPGPHVLCCGHMMHLRCYGARRAVATPGLRYQRTPCPAGCRVETAAQLHPSPHLLTVCLSPHVPVPSPMRLAHVPPAARHVAGQLRQYLSGTGFTGDELVRSRRPCPTRAATPHGIVTTDVLLCGASLLRHALLKIWPPRHLAT